MGFFNFTNKSNSKTEKENNEAQEVFNEFIKQVSEIAELGIQSALINDVQKEWTYMNKLYNIVHNYPKLLLSLNSEQCEAVGSAFSIFLVLKDYFEKEDMKLNIANYAFLLLSREIDDFPSIYNYQKRFTLLADTHSFFYETIADALNIPGQTLTHLIPRRNSTNNYIYAMGKYDYERADFGELEYQLEEFHQLCIRQNNSNINDGGKYIEATVKHIENLIK